MDSTLSNFLLTLACITVVFLGLMVVLAYVVIRRLSRFTSPDIGELQRQFAQLQKEHPNGDPDSLLSTIIQRQSLRCGIVGAIAGLGGFVTLPIALPVDVLLSLRIQATLVQFIATTYAQSSDSSAGQRLQRMLLTSGSVRVTETAFSTLTKFALRLLGKSLSIFIPVIGVVIGFAVNYVIAQATGQAALRWYSRASHQNTLPSVTMPD